MVVEVLTVVLIVDGVTVVGEFVCTVVLAVVGLAVDELWVLGLAVDGVTVEEEEVDVDGIVTVDVEAVVVLCNVEGDVTGVLGAVIPEQPATL